MDRRSVAIVGVAESPLGKVSNEHPLRMMARATMDALDDAGLQLRDVDGLMNAGFPSWSPTLDLADYLGIHPRFVNSTDVGGSSFEFHVASAAAAIGAGLCETVVIAYANTPKQDRDKPGYGYTAPPYTFHEQFERGSGLMWPDIGAYALAADRHMFEFGTTSEQLAEVAVAARRWAQLNPKAYRREPLSIDDVLSSPIISSPLHTRDCCLITDGGGAVIVTTAERARNLRKVPVSVLGYGQQISHGIISMVSDLVRTGAAESGRRAFAMAGLSPSDIDVVQIYDSFTITVILSLEDLGFCQKGEGGAFVEGGRIAPGGSFPLNTSGGGMSYCHPGRFGIFLLIEATRQLRGECGERQAPHVEVALAHGTGGVYSSSATIILGKGIR